MTATLSPTVVERPGHTVVRTRFFALRFHRRVLAQVVAALGILMLASLWAMTQGTLEISIREAFLAAIDRGEAAHEQVIQTLRMPRVLTAALVGATLALSGMIFQGLFRNELASPDIIGINSGAGAVGFIWLLVTRDAAGLPFALFFGAMGVAVAIYVFSWKAGIDPSRLILVGMGLQAVLGAAETMMIRLFTIEDVIWADNLLLGSVAGAEWSDVRLLAVGTAVLLPCALLLARSMRALQLGDDTAASVGMRVELTRFALIALGCWFSALAISVAGLVGFVALMVPHIARMIGGPVSASVLLLAGLIGAILVVVGDTLGSNYLPVTLPVSIVMGIIGAPFFLFLFWRARVQL